MLEADVWFCVPVALLPRRPVENDGLSDLDEAERGLINALQPG